MDEKMKQDGSTWLGSVLVELSEKRVLMDQMCPRHGNAQEAKGGRVCIYVSIFGFD